MGVGKGILKCPLKVKNSDFVLLKKIEACHLNKTD